MKGKRELSISDEIRPDMDAKAASLMRAHEREREIQIDDRMNPTDILFFPIEKVPYGWTYKWVRRSVLGVPDFNHERSMLWLGYTPVPADRHPEEARHHLSGETNVGNVIERKGLILCEIPTSVANKYMAKRDKSHQDVMRSLSKAVEQMPQDPTIPTKIFENSDDVTPSFGFPITPFDQGSNFGFN